MLRRIFTKTGCGITVNVYGDNLIHMQEFNGKYKLGYGEVIEVKLLPLFDSKSAETNTDED